MINLGYTPKLYQKLTDEVAYSSDKGSLNSDYRADFSFAFQSLSFNPAKRLIAQLSSDVALISAKQHYLTVHEQLSME